MVCTGDGTSSCKPRGALIVFEGIDRSGKTTQCSRLVEVLNESGLKAEMWRFPDRSTALGKTINDYLASKSELDDAVIHLLFAANRFEKRTAILDALAAGTTLVIDRYSYSGIAYTSAKLVPHLDMSWCRASEAGLPAPDLIIYMSLSPEVSAKRGGYGEERYEKAAFQQQVALQFEAQRDASWAVVDASPTPDELNKQVVALALPVVQRCIAGGAPMFLLWDKKTVSLGNEGSV